MKDFVKFLSRKSFVQINIPGDNIETAFLTTFKDSKFHYPDTNEKTIYESIIRNGDELPVFLYRLGNSLLNSTFHKKEYAMHMIHWIMKEICSCEIYFNNNIDQGFLMVHGEGTVIGSRNNIGKGFIIHQGCTIGHKKNGMGKISGQGCHIGNNVTIYVNSTIIGEIQIGDNVIVGAHTLVKENVPANSKIVNRLFPQIIK